MRQQHVLLVALLSVVGPSADLMAGQRLTAPLVPVAIPAGARIIGVVRDDAGHGIDGVTIVAMGTSLAMAKSAATGAFELVVPTGQYVLRALREGYVSTFREAVQVDLDVPLERTITLVRANARSLAFEQRLPAQSSGTGPAESAAPSETAWRLRHLPRTVLRDRVTSWAPDPSEALERDDPTLWNGGQSRSFWDAADVRGHVDFLTTSSVAAAPRSLLSGQMPRGVAYVVLGAPVGSHGAWSARAALSPGDASAWTLRADYEARSERRHAFRTGVAHSAQTLTSDTANQLVPARPSDVRRVAGAYGYDRWSVGRGLELSYGGRLDRVDYLAEPTLVGGTLGVEQAVTTRVSIRASTTRHRVAPGADVFQPPAAEGVWLPPDRTFSALDGQSLHAATIDRHEVGVVWSVLTSGAVTPLEVRVERFREVAIGQVATLFGTDAASRVGHFHVAPVGSATLEGLSVGVSLVLSPHLRGRVDYVVGVADWWDLSSARSAALVVEQFGRARHRRLHDVTSALEALLPATDTTLSFAWRLNDGFASATRGRQGVGARFSLEVRQPLPIGRMGPDAFTAFLAARTLQGDLGSGGYFDDLATIAPPLRVTGGIQVRF